MMDIIKKDLKIVPAEFPVYPTLRIVTDRGVSHELVRHRTLSFTQESTRYVNYCKKTPQFIDQSLYTDLSEDNKKLIHDSYEHDMIIYNSLLENGASTNQAREVLPNGLATTIIVSGHPKYWDAFLDLRRDQVSHYLMHAVADFIGKHLLDQ